MSPVSRGHAGYSSEWTQKKRHWKAERERQEIQTDPRQRRSEIDVEEAKTSRHDGTRTQPIADEDRPRGTVDSQLRSHQHGDEGDLEQRHHPDDRDEQSLALRRDEIICGDWHGKQ